MTKVKLRINEYGNFEAIGTRDNKKKRAIKSQIFQLRNELKSALCKNTTSIEEKINLLMSGLRDETSPITNMQIIPGRKDILLIELIHPAVFIEHNGNPRNPKEWVYEYNGDDSLTFELSDGNWEFIGILGELNEYRVRELINELLFVAELGGTGYTPVYKDLSTNGGITANPYKAFSSLLRSHNILHYLKHTKPDHKLSLLENFRNWFQIEKNVFRHEETLIFRQL